MDLKHRHRVLADDPARQALGRADGLDEIVDQFGDVLAPLRQGRHPDRHDVQAVEQVLTEPAFGNLRLQVSRSGCDDAHIDLHVLFAADPTEALIHQNPQDAALALTRHVADLVQIEGAVVRPLEHPDLARPAVLSLFPEQFDVQSLGRHSGGRDGDELGARARAGFVDLTRHKLLARPGRTGNQHPAVGLGHLGDGAAQSLGRLGAADQAGRRHRLRAQTAVLAFQRRRLDRPLDHHHQPIRLERLFDEVIGAALQRGHRRLDIAVARDHHHRQVGVDLLDHLQQFQPVQTAALHPDVEDRQRGLPCADRRQGLVGIGGHAHGVPLILEQARNQIADVRLVVDDQNVGTGRSHLASLIRRRRSGACAPSHRRSCRGVSGGRSGTRARRAGSRRPPASARRRGPRRCV